MGWVLLAVRSPSFREELARVLCHWHEETAPSFGLGDGQLYRVRTLLAKSLPLSGDL